MAPHATPTAVDPRLAPLVSGELDEADVEASSVAGLLRTVAGAVGLAGLADHLRADPALRVEALGLLPRLVRDGLDALGNANDVAVAALLDALCRAGEAPEGLEAGLAGPHGLWWGPLVLASHACAAGR